MHANVWKMHPAGQLRSLGRPVFERSALAAGHFRAVVNTKGKRMRMLTTGTKTFVLLAGIAALGVLGTVSTSWAQRGNVRACSLSGVNPADHPNIFNDPATAKSYGFVQVNGAWHVSRDLCHRGRIRRGA
jgi:hypothetical protein